VGAKLITKLDDFSEDDLGYADLVEERKLGKKKVVFIEGCKNPKAVCILVRSGIKNVGYEVERRIIDAISSIKYTLEEEKFLAGGGATEMELAKNIKLKADSISGKRQIAVKKFADSLEIIPKTLIETAGLNQIDLISELRAVHDPKNDNWTTMGIDFKTRKPGNMINLGIIDSFRAKYHAINAAMDVVKLILKIDDVIDQAEESAYAPPPKPREDFEED
jgi:chaperonin GroEL (HSP60 family)